MVVKPIHAIVVSALLKLIPKEWYHSFCLCFTTHKILQFGFAEPNPQHVHSPAIPGPLWTFALPQGLKDLSRNTSHCEQRGVASSCNCEVEARGKAKLEQTNLPLQFEVGKESIYSWRDDNDNCFSGPELGYTIYIYYIKKTKSGISMSGHWTRRYNILWWQNIPTPSHSYNAKHMGLSENRLSPCL